MNYSKEVAKKVEEVTKEFTNKRILILGFGREGISTFRFFATLHIQCEIYIMDCKGEDTDVAKIEKMGYSYTLLPQKAYLQDMGNYDYIFKTPGLPGYEVDHIPSKKIMLQSELFIKYYGERTIGVTGTKGKTTTSSLIGHILEKLGQKVVLVGNMGFPALDMFLQDDGESIYVYELSSFQTEFLDYTPKVAVLLNFFEEHLNNYRSYEAYKMSKMKLFTGEAIGYKRHLVVGVNNEPLINLLQQMIMKQYVDIKDIWGFGEYDSVCLEKMEINKGLYKEKNEIMAKEREKKTKICNEDFHRKLLGDHNVMNILAAVQAVVCMLQTKNMTETKKNELYKKAIYSVETFEGLEHRLEFVGKYNNLDFYNDSIATIPEAVIKAVEAIKEVETLIIGGYDRGIQYDELVQYLSQLPNIRLICLPTTGHKIADTLRGMRDDVYKVENIQEAVDLAFKETSKNKAVVLSPGASSYNQFKNFEERGNVYKDYIRSYKGIG